MQDFKVSLLLIDTPLQRFSQRLSPMQVWVSFELHVSDAWCFIKANKFSFFVWKSNKFSCLIQLSCLSQSLWSGYHWKDLFLWQNLSIDDANFGQGRWRQNKARYGRFRFQSDWIRLDACFEQTVSKHDKLDFRTHTITLVFSFV